MMEVLESLFDSRADQIYTVAVILAMPWILAIINRQRWSSDVKSLAAIAACFIAAALWLVFHEFATNKFVIYAAILIGATQVIYQFFKPGLKELEAKTG
jgi:hypothetical protein